MTKISKIFKILSVLGPAGAQMAVKFQNFHKFTKCVLKETCLKKSEFVFLSPQFLSNFCFVKTFRLLQDVLVLVMGQSLYMNSSMTLLPRNFFDFYWTGGDEFYWEAPSKFLAAELCSKVACFIFTEILKSQAFHKNSKKRLL